MRSRSIAVVVAFGGLIGAHAFAQTTTTGSVTGNASGSTSGSGGVSASGTDTLGGSNSGGSGSGSGSVDQILKLEGADIPDFDKIRTPDSPAFTLLGVSPTQIERPTTPKELTAVVSKFSSEGDVVIPKNFAAEFSPFSVVTAGQDVNVYLQRPWYQQFWQNATVSAATATSTRDVTDGAGMVSTHTDSTLGVGARTLFTLSGEQHAGCSDDELKSFIAVATSEQMQSDSVGLELAREKVAEIQAKVTALKRPLTQAEVDAISANYDAKESSIKAKLADANNTRLASLCIKEIASAHRGWLMDAALATGFTFPDGVAKEGKYSLSAGWVDIAYEADNASFVALARGRDDKSSGKHNYTSDLGMRGIVAKDAYAASLELIWRHVLSRDDGAPGADDTYRVAVALDIHLTDGTWLTLSFGKDFDSSATGSLFSLANLKYGIGDPKVKVKR